MISHDDQSLHHLPLIFFSTSFLSFISLLFCSISFTFSTPFFSSTVDDVDVLTDAQGFFRILKDFFIGIFTGLKIFFFFIRKNCFIYFFIFICGVPADARKTLPADAPDLFWILFIHPPPITGGKKGFLRIVLVR